VIMFGNPQTSRTRAHRVAHARRRPAVPAGRGKLTVMKKEGLLF